MEGSYHERLVWHLQHKREYQSWSRSRNAVGGPPLHYSGCHSSFRVFSGPSVMRGAAAHRALVAEKLFPDDIDARARKVRG